MILSLATNNPIEEAGEAKFKENIKSYQAGLTLWLSKEYVKLDGNLKVDSINATYESGEYNGLKIQDIITNMSDKIGGYTEDATKFSIVKGELIYSKQDNEKEKEWAKEAGVADGSVPDVKPSIPNFNENKGVNKPQLATGMTAVKWNTVTSKWDTIKNPDTDDSWYDYHTKQWANAQTADGSMWVWIPRYVYRIPTQYWHKTANGVVDIQFSQGINDDWNQSKIGLIDRQEIAEASNGKWTFHPAFTFGDTQVLGIWVAKFRASSVEGYQGNATDNSTEKTVQIKPGVRVWANIKAGNMFDVCRLMETKDRYGWGTTGEGIDTHLIKNSEWGCVAYLCQSKYGLEGTTIAVNNTHNSGGNSTLAYVDNAAQSTTGNITGIYDMSGVGMEYIAAYVDNGLTTINTYSASIKNAAEKYRDEYEKGASNLGPNNYELSKNHKGDALYETSAASELKTAWYGTDSYMPCDNPICVRGNSGIFALNTSSGFNQSTCSFRPILLVSDEL